MMRADGRADGRRCGRGQRRLERGRNARGLRRNKRRNGMRGVEGVEGLPWPWACLRRRGIEIEDHSIKSGAARGAQDLKEVSEPKARNLVICP
jgi:hypothetical protein